MYMFMVYLLYNVLMSMLHCATCMCSVHPLRKKTLCPRCLQMSMFVSVQEYSYYLHILLLRPLLHNSHFKMFTLENTEEEPYSLKRYAFNKYKFFGWRSSVCGHFCHFTCSFFFAQKPSLILT